MVWIVVSMDYESGNSIIMFMAKGIWGLVGTE